MQVLDDLEDQTTPKPIYSRLSFAIAIITLLLLGTLNSYIPKKIILNQEIPKPPEVLVWAILISCLLGFLMTLISFQKKESPSAAKWIGALLNVVFFILIFGFLFLRGISK